MCRLRCRLRVAAAAAANDAALIVAQCDHFEIRSFLRAVGHLLKVRVCVWMGLVSGRQCDVICHLPNEPLCRHFSFLFPLLLFLHFFKRDFHRVLLGACHHFRSTWCVGSQEAAVAAVNQVVLWGDARRAANCISQKRQK